MRHARFFVVLRREGRHIVLAAEPTHAGAFLDIGGYADVALVGLALGSEETNGVGALLDIGGYADAALVAIGCG